jgi:hypothetical protein
MAREVAGFWTAAQIASRATAAALELRGAQRRALRQAFLHVTRPFISSGWFHLFNDCALKRTLDRTAHSSKIAPNREEGIQQNRLWRYGALGLRSNAMKNAVSGRLI